MKKVYVVKYEYIDDDSESYNAKVFISKEKANEYISSLDSNYRVYFIETCDLIEEI
jgi:hypothetical protein